MDETYSRRRFLRTAAAGAAVGAGALASSTGASAAGAPFGDGVNLQPSYFCGGD